MIRDPLSRWLSHVEKQSSGCWLWTGYRLRSGYGQLTSGGKQALAHRWIYEYIYGPVPEGLELDHFACDNPPCVNPAHVRPVTRRENALRGNTFSAANLSKTHCPHGHAYAGRNLHFTPKGYRRCRTCARLRNRVGFDGTYPLEAAE